MESSPLRSQKSQMSANTAAVPSSASSAWNVLLSRSKSSQQIGRGGRLPVKTLFSTSQTNRRPLRQPLPAPHTGGSVSQAAPALFRFNAPSRAGKANGSLLASTTDLKTRRPPQSSSTGTFAITTHRTNIAQTYDVRGPSAELGHLEQQFRELEQQGIIFQAEIRHKNAKIEAVQKERTDLEEDAKRLGAANKELQRKFPDSWDFFRANRASQKKAGRAKLSISRK